MNIKKEQQSPNSDLEKIQLFEFSFNNLGIWRKIYIYLNWFFFLAYSIVAMYVIWDKNPEFDPGIMMLMIPIVIAYAFWIHIAISKRKINQLRTLALIQLFPFFNLLGCFIFFAIRSTSKQEVRQYGH